MTRATEPEASAPPRWQTRAKQIVGGAVLLGALVAVGLFLGRPKPGAPAPNKNKEHWAFVDPKTPADLGLVPKGTGGTWALEDHPSATGGRALANHEGKLGGPPALLVAAAPKTRDLKTLTRCKVTAVTAARDAGDPAYVPAACGVVFRFVDEQSYWVARVDIDRNLLEVVVRRGGKEQLLGRTSAGRTLAVDEWVALSVEARGDVVKVGLDPGPPTLVAEVPAVHAAFGGIGLWAPSEATVYFDHFTIETLAPSPRALEILPVLGKKAG